MTSLQDYSDECNIHGIDYLIKAKSVALKIFWSVLIITAATALIYESYNSVRYYCSKPVSVKIVHETVTHNPLILVCPSVWVNETKLAQIGDPVEIYKYWIGLQYDFDKEDAAMLHPRLKSIGLPQVTNDINRYFQGDIERQGQISAILNSKYSSVRDFLMEISLDSEDVFLRPEGVYEYPNEKVPNSQRVCYLLNSTYPNNDFVSSFMKYEVIVKDVDAPPGFNSRKSHRIHFGISRDNIAMNGIELVMGRNYRIYLSASKYSTVSTPSNPCAGSSVKEFQSCGFDCVNSHVCSKCQLIDVNKATNFSRLCTLHDFFVGRGHCLLNFFTADNDEDGPYRSCTKSCPLPCVSWRYTPSVVEASNVSPNGVTNVTGVSIKYHEAAFSHFLEESYAYNWQTLVSNLGGLMSLFFGTSLLSIVHVVVFCARRSEQTIC